MQKKFKSISLIGIFISLFLSGCSKIHREWQVRTDSMKYPATFRVPADGNIAEVQKKVRILLKKKPQKPVIV